MTQRFFWPTIFILGLLFLASCSDDNNLPKSTDKTENSVAQSEELTEFPIYTPNKTYTLESFTSSGFKKSKEYPTDTVPLSKSIYYGFFNMKDIEIRFYENHSDVLSEGLKHAESSITRPKQKGGGLKGAGTFSIKGYGAYIIAGNTVMLCELDISTCEDLLRTMGEIE
tara:strand:+ start:96 stop:602 length:507 start_codon:yes stop_codon:yes gene_type:complete